MCVLGAAKSLCSRVFVCDFLLFDVFLVGLFNFPFCDGVALTLRFCFVGCSPWNKLYFWHNRVKEFLKTIVEKNWVENISIPDSENTQRITSAFLFCAENGEKLLVAGNKNLTVRIAGIWMYCAGPEQLVHANVLKGKPTQTVKQLLDALDRISRTKVIIIWRPLIDLAFDTRASAIAPLQTEI